MEPHVNPNEEATPFFSKGQYRQVTDDSLKWKAFF